LLVDAQLVNLGTVKSIRNERVRGVSDNFLFLLRLGACGERAKARQRQKDADQDYKEAE